MNIYQIETTNRCNATCSYCPHSKMTRAKGNMDMRTFRQCLNVMDNDYVALHHFGEPFMNMLLPNFIELADGYGIDVEFSTNGGTTNTSLIKSVMEAMPRRMRIAYDEFRPHSFIKEALTHNINTVVTLHSVKGLLSERKPYNNFAGAMEGTSDISGECYFKKYGYVCVLWNGDIVPCCQDFDGKEIIGNVFEPIVSMQNDYALCAGCSGMQFAKDGGWNE